MTGGGAGCAATTQAQARRATAARDGRRSEWFKELLL
jgi:hypothetical protein